MGSSLVNRLRPPPSCLRVDERRSRQDPRTHPHRRRRRHVKLRTHHPRRPPRSTRSETARRHGENRSRNQKARPHGHAQRSDPRILGPSKPAAGTDAKITFVVRGELGIAKKTVDTSLQGRMESGKTDFVVIHSRDLGNLFEVTIYNDMGASFLGNSAWRCDKISVVSVTYGVDVTAVFGVNIDATPFTRSFA
ncbi:hypothetical protein BKA61DRAFT_614919 [Leptodontidium sp. MPI-SDFR-AT-0119]|nr:hypothetical protein BKA61DRAFT_614919 [Leptodontidium sp. MPI-SDFR-AT-0119]